MGLLNSGATFASIVESVILLINLLLGVLAALAIVVFFYGLVLYVYKSGDAHAHEEGRERIVWSLIALFALFSIWGILALLQISFFGGTVMNSGTYSPSYGNTSAQSSGTFQSSSNAIY
ncbi:MAG: hypothetical protein KGH79_00870 [Patescibacteria group bacterium]|nr:hypothetical protein [Patescibacteria group bacterium]